MASLTEELKTEVVTRLACFEGPSEILEDFKRRGVEISVQGIAYYDPGTREGRRLASKWKELFHETRRRYTDDLSAIAIAHQAHRLREMDWVAKRAKRVGNFALMLQAHEQAAKERGGAYLGKARSGVADVDVRDWEEIQFLERIAANEDPYTVAADRARWLAEQQRNSEEER